MPRPRGPLKLHWMPFYPAEYLRDTRCLTPASRGVWVDILCLLHDAPKRGQLALTAEAWAKHLTVSQADFEAAVKEYAAYHICHMSGNGKGPITIKSRRMLREEAQREADRRRKQKEREK